MTIPLPAAISLTPTPPSSPRESGSNAPTRPAVDPELELARVRSASPWVLIGVTHPAMRRLILALLDREPGSWSACLHPAAVATALRDLDPDLAIVDGVDFPRCCGSPPAGYSRSRVVVIGREPDTASRSAALGLGAGGWVARDDIGEQLTAEMRSVLARLEGLAPASE